MVFQLAGVDELRFSHGAYMLTIERIFASLLDQLAINPVKCRNVFRICGDQDVPEI